MLSYYVTALSNFTYKTYLSPEIVFLRYCEYELLLLTFEVEIVFYKAGVARVRALLRSLLAVCFFFLLVQELVSVNYMRAFKY
jgi:intein/homing endonuclease